MATKIRLFCVEERVVILENKEICGEIVIDKEVLKEKILKNIQKYRSLLETFRKSLEEMTNIKFAAPNFQYAKKSIYDSSFYREFLDFMLQTEYIKKKSKRMQEVRKAEKNYQTTEGVIERYEDDIKLKRACRKAKQRRK